MKKLILFLFFILFASAEAQYTPVNISFDTVFTNTAGSKSFYVKNPTNKPMQITSIRTLTQQFYFTTTPFTINPLDSVLLTVLFKSKQNISYKDFFILENNILKYSLVYYLNGTAKYPDALYNFTQGLIDEPLKTALRSFTTTGYVTLGYNTARDHMFATVDKYLTNDTIECVYIGRKIRAVNRTEAQNQNFNTEHTYPQSFFNSNDPMVSDLYHLYPTDATPNNYRSNYAFGFVLSNITYENNGSKLGRDYQNEIVFEPRDVHKGNVARSLFYFCVKYSTQSIGAYMSLKQENALRQFNLIDTVNANERLRNDRIAALQHVRNPFIDHPELIDRIKSTFSVITTTSTPKISASPFNVMFDTLAVNDTSSYYVSLLNYGSGNLTVTSVTSNSSQFNVESFPSVVPQGEMRFVKVKFRPTQINQTYNGQLTVQNSDSNIVINLTGYSNNFVGIKQISGIIPNTTQLFQNYPNPFNPNTIIKFSIPENGKWKMENSIVTLKIFDILGKEVATLVNEEQSAGVYEVNFNGSNLSSGMYFYKLTVNGVSVSTKILNILK